MFDPTPSLASSPGGDPTTNTSNDAIFLAKNLRVDFSPSTALEFLAFLSGASPGSKTDLKLIDIFTNIANVSSYYLNTNTNIPDEESSRAHVTQTDLSHFFFDMHTHLLGQLVRYPSNETELGKTAQAHLAAIEAIQNWTAGALRIIGLKNYSQSLEDMARSQLGLEKIHSFAGILRNALIFISQNPPQNPEAKKEEDKKEKTDTAATTDTSKPEVADGDDDDDGISSPGKVAEAALAAQAAGQESTAPTPSTSPDYIPPSHDMQLATSRVEQITLNILLAPLQNNEALGFSLEKLDDNQRRILTDIIRKKVALALPQYANTLEDLQDPTKLQSVIWQSMKLLRLDSDFANGLELVVTSHLEQLKKTNPQLAGVFADKLFDLTQEADTIFMERLHDLAQKESTGILNGISNAKTETLDPNYRQKAQDGLGNSLKITDETAKSLFLTNLDNQINLLTAAGYSPEMLDSLDFNKLVVTFPQISSTFSAQDFQGAQREELIAQLKNYWQSHLVDYARILGDGVHIHRRAETAVVRNGIARQNTEKYSQQLNQDLGQYYAVIEGSQGRITSADILAATSANQEQLAVIATNEALSQQAVAHQINLAAAQRIQQEYAIAYQNEIAQNNGLRERFSETYDIPSFSAQQASGGSPLTSRFRIADTGALKQNRLFNKLGGKLSQMTGIKQTSPLGGIKGGLQKSVGKTGKKFVQAGYQVAKDVGNAAFIAGDNATKAALGAISTAFGVPGIALAYGALPKKVREALLVGSAVGGAALAATGVGALVGGALKAGQALGNLWSSISGGGQAGAGLTQLGSAATGIGTGAGAGAASQSLSSTLSAGKAGLSSSSAAKSLASKGLAKGASASNLAGQSTAPLQASATSALQTAAQTATNIVQAAATNLVVPIATSVLVTSSTFILLNNVLIQNALRANFPLYTQFETIDPTGKKSEYLDLEKQARVVSGCNDEKCESPNFPVTVEYTIIVTPKDDYTITLHELNDTLSVRQNTKKYEELGISPAQIPEKLTTLEEMYKASGYEATSFVLIPPGESLTLTYTTVFDEKYNHSFITNSVSAIFDWRTPTLSDSGEAISGAGFGLGEAGGGAGCWPVSGTITQLPFSIDGDPSWSHASRDACGGESSDRGADAYDIAGNTGFTVYAPFDGVAVYHPQSTGPNTGCGGYGNYVVLDTTDGRKFFFGHLAAGLISNQTVQPGTPIGIVGSSGCSSGAHLHYEMRGASYCSSPPSQTALQTPDPGIGMGGGVISCYDN